MTPANISERFTMGQETVTPEISRMHSGSMARNIAAAALFGLSSLGLTSLGQAQIHGPLPATPCPCAADGMCYPRRETWGNYQTHWRAWPGETVGLAPTAADGAEPGLKDQLPTYIRPGVQQEDLRGPIKPTRPAAPAAGGAAAAVEAGLPPLDGGAQPGQPGVAAPAADPAAAPADNGGGEAAPPANDAFDLPGFGPQGNLQPLPQLEEGPPALPSSLSQALMNTPLNLQTQSIAKPTVTANTGVSARPVVKVIPSQARYVTPASAIDTSHIELANPAAANVQKSMEQDLQQAIYFEASDMPPAGGR